MNRLLFIRFYAFLTIIVSVILLGVSDDVFMIANIHFYLLVMLAFLEILAERSISLMSVWILGFIYVILSDILLNCYGPEYSWAAKFMLLSNDVVVLGYYLKKSTIKEPAKTIIEPDKPSKYFGFVYAIFYVIFLVYVIPQTIEAIAVGGRNVEHSETNIFASTLLGGYKVMPLIIAAKYAWFNPKRKWIAILIALPFLFADFFAGTRFRFLFSILPFLVIAGYLNLRELKMRSIISIIITVAAIALLSSIMLATRMAGNSGETEAKEIDLSNHPYGEYFSVKVCSEGSPEGTVPMMTMLKQYLETHDYTYGMSTSFIFYFWVPRSIWPDKPTMIGHWLPHMYMTGISEGHSASLGFTGEPYADFGYFSLLIYLFMGVLMRKGNNFIKEYDYGRIPCIQSLIAVLLIPYVFFAVRSPVTATCYTAMQILIVYLFYKLLFTSRTTSKITNNV